MSEFTKLIQAASDDGRLLSGVLLKAQVLAARLPSRSFRQWVQWELNGYRKRDELPVYRVLPATLVGLFVGWGNALARNVPLSTSHLRADARAYFEQQPLFDGVGYVEDLLAGEGTIGHHLGRDDLEFLRQVGAQIEDMILNDVEKRVARHSLVTLLTSARSRLLDFLLTLRNKYPALDTDDSAAARVSEGDVEAVARTKVYHDCTVYEGNEMRDLYQTGQAGAVGPNAKAENINFIQVLRGAIGDSSLGELAGDLERLRAAMLTQSKSADQDAAIAAVAQAEEATKKGDAQGVLACLKSAGKWAVDVATGIGSTVAAKAIETAMGL